VPDEDVRNWAFWRDIINYMELRTPN
jgi:hypothetical protein